MLKNSVVVFRRHYSARGGLVRTALVLGFVSFLSCARPGIAIWLYFHFVVVFNP